MSADQKHQLGPFTRIATKEYAEALTRAADLMGGIAVTVLDPSVPEEAETFAIAAALQESTSISSHRVYNGQLYQPRTTEEIKREVVGYALDAGMTLVVITHSQSLNDLWKLANHIPELAQS
jgi:hypothetical protein